MAQFSFDIESTYDKAEMNNVEQLVTREIANRYDFKGTPAGIEWLADKKGFKVIGSNEWQLDSVIDMIGKQLAKRDMTSVARHADRLERRKAAAAELPAGRVARVVHRTGQVNELVEVVAGILVGLAAIQAAVRELRQQPERQEQ